MVSSGSTLSIYFRMLPWSLASQNAIPLFGCAGHGLHGCVDFGG